MFVDFGGQLFIQATGTPMGTDSNLSILLATWQLQFVQILNLARTITLLDGSTAHMMAQRISKVSAITVRYVDDLSSINNPQGRKDNAL